MIYKINDLVNTLPNDIGQDGKPWIDEFNHLITKNNLKFPRGVKMRYDYSWCACYVSTKMLQMGWIKAPIEISVQYLRNKIRDIGAYRESNNYEPKPGDIIFFNWNMDNWLDHIGFVVSYDTKSKMLVTIEGNKGGKVGKRITFKNKANVVGFGDMHFMYEKGLLF